MADELKPIPRNPALGQVADLLNRAREFAGRYQVLPQVPLLGGTGVDELLGLPGAAREVENWSYGDYPMRVNPYAGRTASYMPEFKKGRASDLADLAMVAQTASPLAKGALRVVADMPSIVSRAGREFLQSNVPVHVIKPKGGNWLTGSVEEAIRPLKRGLPERPGEVPRNVPPGVSWRGMVSAMENQPEGLAYLDELRTTNPEVYARLYSDAALNKWLDTKLSKYLRNEMGTPEDPIRALAERGVLHERPAIEGPIRYAITNRESAGYPVEGMAQSELARLWENAADSAIMPRTAGQQLKAEYPYNAETMPWLEKVPPDSPVYAMSSMDPIIDNLGFRHLRDELRNALNPESGLPANLLLTPEQLDRVSTPQAVELVHKINEYRAAEKAAADFKRATGPATHLFKDYPEAGYKWVELKAPGEWPSGEARMATKDKYGDLGRYARSTLEDALKYEGDTMGHCVGGYCPDVLEGRSRIFSLRSAKGEPHVTIEAAPGVEGEPMNIIQIKGKQNLAPKEKYLPFVQDFVRSQKWGDIGDFQNAGLYDVGSRESLQQLAPRIFPQENEYVGAKMLQKLLPPGDQRYFTEQELRDLVQSQNKAQGFASGGLVTYNPAEVERLTAPLRAELGLQ